MVVSNFKDLTGMKFGRLTVIQRFGSKGGKAEWSCLCDCGKETIVNTFRLNSGSSKSCGCLRLELRTKHGCNRIGKRTNEYQSWYAMIQRCTNPNHKQFKDYGERGITVCDEWRDFTNFLRDMKEKPSSKYSLDRKNNDGNYEPNNCKWSAGTEQSRNRRVINKNGISGVYWEEGRNSFVARIGLYGKNLFLGRYSNVEDAIKAREDAEIKYWGKSS